MASHSVFQIEPDLYAIEVPLGKAGLTVRCYLIKDGDEAIAVDAATPEATGAILSLMAEKGVRKLRLLALTHSHADHIGAAYQLKKETGCLIAIDRNGAPLLMNADLRFHDFVGAFPLQLPASEQKQKDWYRTACLPVEPDIFIQDRSWAYDFGRFQLQAIPAAGHSWDCISYYIPQRGWLFTGDAVDGNGTPTHMPCYRDMDIYRQSLESLRQLNIQRLLSGHYSVMEESQADNFLILSLQAIRHIHQDIKDVLKDAKQPLNLEEICQKVAQKAEKEYSLQTLFTTSAHLNQLRRIGMVRKYGVEGALYMYQG